jgi:ammonia channel protein AmtB
MWDVIGFSLVFGNTKGGFIGDFKHIFLEGV